VDVDATGVIAVSDVDGGSVGDTGMAGTVSATGVTRWLCVATSRPEVKAAAASPAPASVHPIFLPMYQLTVNKGDSGAGIACWFAVSCCEIAVIGTVIVPVIAVVISAELGPLRRCGTRHVKRARLPMRAPSPRRTRVGHGRD
jgi:hypothetical protein